MTAPNYRALAAIRHQLRSFLAFSEEAALGHGLEPRQHQLLLAIEGVPEGTRPTVGAIARLLVVKHHSAVELVDRVARAGLVTRRRADADRREVLLGLTPKGKRLLGRLSVEHEAELRRRGPELVRALDSIMRRDPRPGE